MEKHKLYGYKWNADEFIGVETKFTLLQLIPKKIVSDKF